MRLSKSSAVDELKYSVDFWLHYCTHGINTSDYIAFIREHFERVLEYVGYLEYESTLPKDFSRLAMIYTRILENLIHSLDRYFDSFKELAQALPLSELRSAVAVAGTTNAENLKLIQRS